MSEAELHVLKARLHQGKLNKARRGELFNLPPIGYVKLPAGGFALDPDEQVQAVVRLVFDQFDRQGTVHGVLRYLAHNGIRMPVRVYTGADPGRLQWRRPNRPTLQSLLHHPIYAGAYCYGRRPADPRRQQPARPGSGRPGRRAPTSCGVVLRDRLPAYITWERYEANQQRLADNRAHHDALGAPRRGAALLSGLLHCGRCGRRMNACYGGPRSAPGYRCGQATAEYAEPLCQYVSCGAVLDGWVADQVLAAVQPAALEASLAAAADIERERGDLLRHWQQRRERARYEAERAARQYHACEPENRLVARALERQWEEALLRQRQTEEEFECWQRTAPAQLSADDRAAIRALAADLPAVWQAATTTPADHQRVIRLLLERVEVNVDRSSERLEVKATWVGGHEQRQVLARSVQSYAQHSDYPRLAARLRELSNQRLPAWQIAEQLNAQGFRPPKRAARFGAKNVYRLQSRLGLPRRAPMGSRAGLRAGEWRVSELARHLGLRRDTLYEWQAAGWVHAYRDIDGYWVVWADADELARLRALHALPRTKANQVRLARLRKPKRLPKRLRKTRGNEPG
jgi:hypothetical protein